MIDRLRSIFRLIIERSYVCILQRRLPFRRLRGVSLADNKWYNQLEEQIRTTQKIKIGFGPIYSSEHDLNVRKWRIDPIVDYINKISNKYSAGVFLLPEHVHKFDIVILVREIDGIDCFKITRLRKDNKIFVYDIVDQPYLNKDNKNCIRTFEIIKCVDGLIVSSPLNIEDFRELDKNIVLIEHPILNTQKKDYTKRNSREIKIIWQGFSEHHIRMYFIHPIIKKVSSELNKKITIIYHTNLLPKRDGFVRYKTWTFRNWEKLLVKCDIAVENKPLNDPFLQRKPSTKVLTYMAAGLPVICAPSKADKLVIEHGKTGYFAYTEEDWYVYLKKLAEDAELRQAIGEEAKEYVLKNFNIKKITQKYLNYFDELINKKKN